MEVIIEVLGGDAAIVRKKLVEPFMAVIEPDVEVATEDLSGRTGSAPHG